MKKIITLLFISTFVASTGFAWPFKKDPNPQPTPTKTEIIQPAPSPSTGKGLLNDLKKELTDARAKNKELGEALNRAKTELVTSNTKVKELEKGIKDLTDWGASWQAKANKYYEQYTKAVKKYHRLKFIAACIAAVGGVFLGLQLMNLAPPPYNFGVPVGAAALFFMLAWLLL